MAITIWVFLQAILVTASAGEIDVDYGDGEGGLESFCPVDCSFVDCLPRFGPMDCPEDTKYTEKTLFSCCPACVKLLGLGDTCVFNNVDMASKTEELPCSDGSKTMIREDGLTSSGSRHLPVLRLFECGPGLACNATLAKCVDDQDQKTLACQRDKADYFQWEDEQLDTNNCSVIDYPRKCTPSGHYQRVQAKINPVDLVSSSQFCVDPDGVRIFGIEDTSPVEDDELYVPQNCLCSRKHWELSRLREDTITLHCHSDGNYEDLQCDERRCWCVNPIDGSVTSKAVHIDMAKFLNCHDEASFGSQYLRRCESRLYGKTYSDSIMAKHGLLWYHNKPKCDPDGSFAPVNCDISNNGICRCVDKMNQAIDDYKENSIYANTMTCNCARNPETSLQCSISGNYEELQEQNQGPTNVEFCVDNDGFQFTTNYDVPERPTDLRCKMACDTRREYCYTNGQDNGLCVTCDNNCRD